MHKWLLKFSQTKHDDLTIFFPITIMVRNQWKEICMRMTCDSHTNYKFLLWLIPIITPIPLVGWFRFWFGFQCFPKNFDSDSDLDSNSSVPIPIPIPTQKASIPILFPESDSDSGVIYNSGYYALHINNKKHAQSFSEWRKDQSTSEMKS